MNQNKKLPITQRMAKNIEFFSNNIKNETDKNAMTIMVNQLDELLNEIIKTKLVTSFEQDESMDNIAYNQAASFNAKIEACFQIKVIGMDIRAILLTFDTIKEDFHSFGDFNTRNYIKEIVQLSRSELFDMVLTMIRENKISHLKCETLEELIDSLGYRGTLQFIYAVISAALVENLLSI